MKLEQLKGECPVMPENIRQMIEREVKNQLKEHHELPKTTRSIRRPWKKTLAAALIAIMALGTTAYAGVKIYQWNVEKEGNYGLKAGIITKEESIPEKIPELSVKAGWLPDGMTASTENLHKYSYESTPFNGGFSINLIAMDENLSEKDLPLSDTDVTANENININGHQSIYIEKAKGDYNKKIYIAYPEYWQILEIFAGTDMTKSDTLKFAQSIKVAATSEMKPLSDMVTWSEYTAKNTGQNMMKLHASTTEMKNLHKPGEKFEVNTTATVDGNDSEVYWLQAEVTDVRISDNLSILKNEYIASDLAATAESNGKLKKNNIRYINSGDGINDIDKETSSEKVDQKIVKVTIKYTNKGDRTLKNVHYFAGFMGINENKNGYIIYDRAFKDADNGTDRIIADSMGGFGEMDYYDCRYSKDSKNYISSIKPDQTVTVHVAKVINSDELDKMFLSLDTEGSVYEFTKDALEMGYVDIREKSGK